MIPTAALAARLGGRVELLSPLPVEDCLHQLHIGLASSKSFTGQVAADGVVIQRRQETGLASAYRSPMKRETHLELRLNVRPYGAGSRLTGTVAWPAIAKVFIGLWAVAVSLFAVQALLKLGEALLYGGLVVDALYEGAVSLAFPIGLAIILAYRFYEEKRALVGFVTELTKAKEETLPQRPRARPIVE